MFKTLWLLLCCLGIGSASFSQARSSIGFGLGANQTFNRYNHELRPGISLLGNIRVINRLAIEPAIGIFEVNNYLSARVSAKYYATDRFFITAGRFFWVGPDLYTGYATTAGAGYRLVNRANRNLELSAHGSFSKYIYDSTPVAAIRVAYNFHFRKM